MKPDIQTSGSYDPRDNMFELYIGALDGPSFNITGLSYADLLEIKSAVDLLAEEFKPPRKRKSK